MMQLSPTEIYALAVKHGFKPGEEAAHATAIAMAESQGNLAAFNPKDSHGGSVGLMQINGANAGLIGGANWKAVGQDPDASMAAAHALYERRGNFTDWGAYTDGRYKQYYNQAAKVASVPGITLNTTPGHPHTLTPSTAGPEYTPSAVAAANPLPPVPPPPTFGESIAKGDVGGALKAAITKPPAKDGEKSKSPLESIADAFGGDKQEAAPQIPEMPAAAPVQDPMAAMAAPAAQLFAATTAASAKPLSWSSAPYGHGAGQIPGTTLNQSNFYG